MSWTRNRIPSICVYLPKKLACGLTPMYQFDENDASLIYAALNRATSMAQAHRRPVFAKDVSARQFLTREILKLYRKGERDVSALAIGADGSLRNYQQMQEFMHRVARPAANVA